MKQRGLLCASLALCVLLVAILTLFSLSGCKQQDKYEWKGHKWEDMFSLFEEQKPMFVEIVDIFSTNDSFWEQCRQYEDDSTAWLMSPYDEEKMRVFSISEQQIITSFFEQTRPYMISVQLGWVKIDYIDEEKTGGFGFVYCYGDNIEQWLHNANALGYTALGNNWFAYIHKESSQQSQAQPEVSESSQSQMLEEPAPMVLNENLLSLIGQPLSALEGDYTNDYFIYEVGSMTGALEYYNPYICFYFDPVGYFNLSGLPENQWDGDPFATDLLTIKAIELQNDFDPVTNTVTNQESLHRLFQTKAIITYAYLTDTLQQTPPLEHFPDGSISIRTDYEIGRQINAVEDGIYKATFAFKGWDIKVTFIETDGDYFAFNVSVGEF